MKSKKPSEYFKEVGPDKVRYASFYDAYLPMIYHRNGGPINILEVGVTRSLNAKGIGSSKAFSLMPYVGEYVGIDTVPPSRDLGDKASFIEGNAYSEDMLREIQSLEKPFHFIIDDGSHLLPDQLYFLQNYPQFCSLISVLVCEDVRIWHVPIIYNNFENAETFKFHTVAYPQNVKGRGEILNGWDNLIVQVNL